MQKLLSCVERLTVVTAVLAVMAATGCELGSFDASRGPDAAAATGGGGGGGGTADAAAATGGGGGGSATADAAGQATDGGTAIAADAGLPAVDAAPIACDNPVSTTNTGKHNAGQACLNCHDGTGDAPLFTLGGTLYTDVNGSAPVTGATIRVTDANGKQITMVTALNGNFYTSSTLAFPVHITASSCPNAAQMYSAVNAGNGSCNASGCHDSSFRIHLP